MQQNQGYLTTFVRYASVGNVEYRLNKMKALLKSKHPTYNEKLVAVALFLHELEFRPNDIQVAQLIKTYLANLNVLFEMTLGRKTIYSPGCRVGGEQHVVYFFEGFDIIKCCYNHLRPLPRDSFSQVFKETTLFKNLSRTSLIQLFVTLATSRGLKEGSELEKDEDFISALETIESFLLQPGGFLYKQKLRSFSAKEFDSVFERVPQSRLSVSQCSKLSLIAVKVKDALVRNKTASKTSPVERGGNKLL